MDNNHPLATGSRLHRALLWDHPLLLLLPPRAQLLLVRLRLSTSNLLLALHIRALHLRRRLPAIKPR
jgi:hypothetical protein